MEIIYLIIWIIFLFYLFLLSLKIKILILEKYIINCFYKRNNLIPSIYEITKNYFRKHDEIFSEIIKLKKINFLENKISSNIYKILYTQKLIHNELDFIFRVCEKHPKLNTNHKFLYIKDNLLENSNKIWKNLELYKKITNKFNKLIFIKNISIIWLFFPINKINNI